jgi:endonuclease YncB( thermonuclease family)
VFKVLRSRPLASAAVLLIATFLSVGTRANTTIVGRADVVDGDTIVVNGSKIRFNGIDAPETDQICLDSRAQQYPCGLLARDRLASKVGAATVSCVVTGMDVYQRHLAACAVSGEDLQRWLVQQGLALSFRHYSHVYDADEEKARQLHVGLWAGSFVAPWDWRHRTASTPVLGAEKVPVSARPALLETRSNPQSPSAACVIKGNVNRTGERIYHVPGQRYYAETRMNKGTGERWFCTESEAQAAGWRRSGR